MLPSTFRKEQQKRLQERKVKPHQKISNTFIENAISRANGNAIKITFYLASILEKQDIDYTKDLNDLTINLKDMLKYTDITAHEARRSLKQMQQTSISFINEKEEEELMVNLLPWIEIKWGKNKVELKLFTKIAKLIIDVKRNYSWINTKVLMKLRNKHSLRMLPILHMIKGFGENIPKRKRYELEELNDIFGTSYKRLHEIERKILKLVKEELDEISDLSFLYEINFSNLGKGRPVATDITIDLVDRKKEQQTNENLRYKKYLEEAKANDNLHDNQQYWLDELTPTPPLKEKSDKKYLGKNFFFGGYLYENIKEIQVAANKLIVRCDNYDIELSSYDELDELIKKCKY